MTKPIMKGYKRPETSADAYVPVLLCQSLVTDGDSEDIVDENWDF
jgi:hypothetical protein